LIFTLAVPAEEKKMDTLATRSVWGTEPDVEDAIQKFQKYFTERIEKDSEFKRRVLALAGKRLGCFCKPKACHGDVIADWLNKMEEKEMDR
jgi:Domain of unknown function (DUF4326)